MMTLPTYFQNLTDFINQWDSLTLLFLALWSIFSVTWYVCIFFIKLNANLPPGPPGLPIFGNLLSLDPNLHSYFASLSQTYGPIFSLRLGSKHGVVITSPSMARQVLKDQDVIFANRDVPVAGRVITYDGCDVVFSSYGSKWRMLRKVLVQWMSRNTTMDFVYELRREEVRKTVAYLYNRVGSPVDVGEEMFLTVLNTSTHTILGQTGEGDEGTEMGLEFREVMTLIMELIGKPNLSDFFPCLAWFDLQGVEKQMRMVLQRFDHIFEKIIKQRLKKKQQQLINGSEAEGSKDFLEFLLKMKDETDSMTPLSMANIKALLVDMVIGGTDTSSNTIEFAMAHLINEPKVMKRVQEELDSIVGKNNMVEESHIQKLPYLLAVMKEVLRLHPVVPLLVPHCPSETTSVGGYAIPKGSRVFVNVWAIHRDPSIWDNPLDFDPTRFLDAQYDYKGSDFSYLPFGFGRRACAGRSVAERTFLYCVATLIHLFDWKVPQDQKLDISEKFSIALKKKTPLIAIPTPRFSNPALYD
ncbi:carnosic acid synthase-like [Prosopis cineraria]|uniref:carnosic acid synthase-like n=1 Tax=Prosopis cineraria TaxID=364024 RepID=UPI00240FAE84|nr:carnosic acid synthase-like [Prosopis cineraria]